MKLMKLQIVLLIVLSFGAACAYSESKPEEQVESFFSLIMSENYKDAYSNLFAGSRIPVENPGIESVMAEQTRKAGVIPDEIEKYDLVIKKEIAGYVVRLNYLMKVNQRLLAWEFVFGQEDGQWVLLFVNFDDKLDTIRGLLYDVEQ